jgi:SAM-dependent methyltransferase
MTEPVTALARDAAGTALSSQTREGSGAMFDGIAKRYDLVNRIISLGIDQSWRRKTVRALELGSGHRVLDLATGTADLGIQVARTELGVSVVGLDPSAKMLDVGREKIARAGLAAASNWCWGTPRPCPLPTLRFTPCASPLAFVTCPIARKPCAKWPASRARAAGLRSSSCPSPARG